MSDVPSLEIIAKTILSSTPKQFQFLVPESLAFSYDVTKPDASGTTQIPYFAAITGLLTNVRQAPFESEPIDHLHMKALPFMCEQFAYVLAAKLILEKKIPGLEYMTLPMIAREKKEILRAAKVTFSMNDIPMSDSTLFEGWVGLQDRPYLPTPDRFYSGRMDIALSDSKKPEVQTRANYHVVRMHK